MNKEGITVDVNALWATLSSAPVGRRSRPLIQEVEDGEQNGHTNGAQTVTTSDGTATVVGENTSKDGEEFVTITHTYEFAGQTVSEQKRVHRDSAEAKLYLATQNPSKQSRIALDVSGNRVALQRPLKRASMFEPNPTGEVKGLPAHRQRLRTPSRTDVLAQQKRLEQEEEEKKAKAQRINTVQKSAIDWAAHVDKEGLRDELTTYDRSKQGYMSKMDFLNNVEGRREQEERRVRLQQQ